MLRQISGISVAQLRHVSEYNRLGEYSVRIVFSGNEGWIPLDITSGSGEFSNKTKKNEAGTSSEQKITAEIPFHRIAPVLVGKLETSNLVARITYNTGDTEVIGTPEFPVTLTTELEAAKSSRYKIELTCTTVYMPMLPVE